MQKQQLFIFRASKGNQGGNPRGSCSLDYSETYKERNAITEIHDIDYDNNDHLEFLHRELRDNNILRQGWGIENLDLSSEESWIERYIISSKKYWGVNIDCNDAKGRWNILNRMTKMKVDDVIIIPKTSLEVVRNEHSKFVVCQVKKPYYFDYPEKFQDFGHCIEVKNKKEYRYGEGNLIAYDFRVPYLYAVSQVKNTHGRYNKFKDFIQREYDIGV